MQVSPVVGFYYDGIVDIFGDFDTSTFGYPVGEPTFNDPFLRLLKTAWNNDVVTVVGCFNDGSHLGDQSPQRFGRSNNPLITACRLTVRGDVSPGNGVELPATFGDDKGYTPLSGHKDIYAIGEGLRLPQSNSQTVFIGGQSQLPPNSYYDRSTGSSFAAPQIAALACYIGGSSLFQPLAAGTVALERKNQIVGLKRTDTNLDAVGAACNGIREQAIPEPTSEPTPTSSAGPESTPEPPRATCVSQFQEVYYLIRIYTSYIKDDGGKSLFDALVDSCVDKRVDNFKAINTATTFKKDGIKWNSKAYYKFALLNVPKLFVSGCLRIAVKESGGPDLNPDCVDTPLVNPP